MMANKKCANCDTCGPCHSTLSILNPIFHRVWQICCTYNWLISRFSYFYVHDNDNDKTNCFTPYTCMQDNKDASAVGSRTISSALFMEEATIEYKSTEHCSINSGCYHYWYWSESRLWNLPTMDIHSVGWCNTWSMAMGQIMIEHFLSCIIVPES